MDQDTVNASELARLLGERGRAARKRVTITCEQCGTVKEGVYAGARFCSPACKARWNYLHKRKEQRRQEREAGS